MGTKKKQRRRERVVDISMWYWIQEHQHEMLTARAPVNEMPGLPPSMSEVLQSFAQPFLDRLPPFVPQEEMLKLAAVAWNMSLLPAEEVPEAAEQLAREITQDAPPEAAVDVQRLLALLILRRIELYSEYYQEMGYQDLERAANSLGIAMELQYHEPEPEEEP